MLNLSIAELVNNVYDHAHSPIDAYVFCQYYQKTDIIKVAVSDLGKGIPKSVNQYKLDQGEGRLTDIECVKWALEENKTVKSMPYNAGKGLDTINHFVKTNKGSWKLFSGDVLMRGFPSRNNYESNPIYNFTGTVIQINISVKNLCDLEFVETDEWNW